MKMAHKDPEDEFSRSCLPHVLLVSSKVAAMGLPELRHEILKEHQSNDSTLKEEE